MMEAILAQALTVGDVVAYAVASVVAVGIIAIIERVWNREL